MHGLSEIIAMNNRPSRVEDNHNRACSYAGDVKSGVVLHSAKLRNTVFLEPWQAKIFLARWNKLRGQRVRNALVESYFE